MFDIGLYLIFKNYFNIFFIIRKNILGGQLVLLVCKQDICCLKIFVGSQILWLFFLFFLVVVYFIFSGLYILYIVFIFVFLSLLGSFNLEDKLIKVNEESLGEYFYYFGDQGFLKCNIKLCNFII